MSLNPPFFGNPVLAPFAVGDEALRSPPHKKQRTHARPLRKEHSTPALRSSEFEDAVAAVRSSSSGSVDFKGPRRLAPARSTLVEAFVIGRDNDDVRKKVRGNPPCSACLLTSSRPFVSSLPACGAREMRIVQAFCSSSSSSSSSHGVAVESLPLIENEFRGKDFSNLCLTHSFERDFLHALHRARQPGDSSRLSLSACLDHPDREKERYCVRCEEFLCEECKAYPTHKGHAALLYDEAMTITKRDLSQRVREMAAKVTDLVEFLPRFRRGFSNEVEAAQENQKQTIREFFERVISRHPEDEEQCRMLCCEILEAPKRPSPPTLAQKKTFFGPVVDIKEHFDALSKFAQSIAEVEDVQVFFSGAVMLNKLFDRLEHPFLAFTPEQHLQQHLEVIKRPNTNIHHFKKAADAKRLPASLVEELKSLSSDELRQVTGFSEIQWDEAPFDQH